jgi:hypothetical protein
VTDLNAIIDEAFADVGYPGDERLTVYRSEGRDADETWKLLRGKDWREMPVQEFITGDTPIPDLTPQALHYYLPALLKASLLTGLSDFVLDSLTFHLNPKNARSDDPEFGYDSTTEYKQFRGLLSTRQVHAVSATIKEWYLRDLLADSEYADLRDAYRCDGIRTSLIPERPLETENPYDPPRASAHEESAPGLEIPKGVGPAIPIALGTFAGGLVGLALLVQEHVIGFIAFVLGSVAGGLYYRNRSRQWPIDPTAKRRRYTYAMLSVILLPSFTAIATGMRGQGLVMTILAALLAASIAAGILVSGDRRA